VGLWEGCRVVRHAEGRGGRVGRRERVRERSVRGGRGLWKLGFQCVARMQIGTR
jgi:hypothetical protein